MRTAIWFFEFRIKEEMGGGGMKAEWKKMRGGDCAEDNPSACCRHVMATATALKMVPLSDTLSFDAASTWHKPAANAHLMSCRSMMGRLDASSPSCRRT
jgi:hypothetical protein